MATKKPTKQARKPAGNSGKTGGKRAPPEGRRFKPGQSGNPKGRPKIPETTKEAFREASPEALETLRSVCRSGKSETARVAAAIHILDRALGKVNQGVELTGKDGAPVKVQAGPLEGRTDEQLVRIAAAAHLALSTSTGQAAQADAGGGTGAEGGGGVPVAEPAPLPAPAPEPAPVEVPPAPVP